VRKALNINPRVGNDLKVDKEKRAIGCCICLALHPLCGSTSSDRENLLRGHEKGWNWQVGDAVHRGRIAQLHNIRPS